MVALCASLSVIVGMTVGATGAMAAPTCGGAKIHAGGSALQAAAQQALWAPAFGGYNSHCGTERVTYSSTSSAAGLNAWGFNGTAVEPTRSAFVGTDEAPEGSQIENAIAALGSDVLVVPVAQTAIGIVVNPPTGCEIEEITNQQLESVMRGNIKIWNKIATASGAGCVNAPITRVVRAEGAGTTYQLKNYLRMINGSGLACTEGGKTWGELAPISQQGSWSEPGEENTSWPESGVGGCSASELSAVQDAAGASEIVDLVSRTEGAIGYAGLPEIENNKNDGENPNGDTNWLRLQNNGTSSKLATAQMATPLEEIGNSAECTHTQYPVPTTARVGSANPANSDWSQVFGSNPNIAGATGNPEAYPLCTLTYDVALTSYKTAGFSEAAEITAKDYLANYVTATEGQEALEVGGKWYAPLPEGSTAFNVLGAAKLAASNIGY